MLNTVSLILAVAARGNLGENVSLTLAVAALLRLKMPCTTLPAFMISVGEETGNLAGILLKVASTYETQVDRSVKTLTSIIEPVMILLLALVAGTIVIALFLPIIDIIQCLGAG